MSAKTSSYYRTFIAEPVNKISAYKLWIPDCWKDLVMNGV